MIELDVFAFINGTAISVDSTGPDLAVGELLQGETDFVYVVVAGFRIYFIREMHKYNDLMNITHGHYHNLLVSSVSYLQPHSDEIFEV